MKPQELREKQSQKIKEARSIHDSAEKEGRDLTAEENERFDQLTAEAEKYGEQAVKLERLDAMEFTARSSRGRASQPEPIELPKETKERYSFLRAVSKVMHGEALDGLEKEVSDEIAKQTGRQPHSFFMPLTLGMERYDLTTTTGTGAVGTVTDASNFVELLRNKMVVNQLGARVLTGLVGNLSLPKQTGGATAAWVNEGSAPSESNATVGQVALSPATVAAFTDLTRKFILQSSMDAEQFARNDLATVLALEIDRAAINGSGSAPEPEGILQNSSVNEVAIDTNGGALTWDHIVQLEKEVAVDNADIGALSYLTNPKVRAECKTTEKASNTAQFLWGPDNTMNGYGVAVTNQVPSNLTKGTGENLSALIFGNFTDLVIGMWSGLDILVDPYTGSSSGTVRIVAMQDVDIALRHPESFARIVDIIAS